MSFMTSEAKIDRRGIEALHFAAERRQTNEVRMLLESGANVTFKSVDGRTALHLAA